MANQPTFHPNGNPPGNKGFIAGLIKENPMVLRSPDHKAGYFWGGTFRGVGSLAIIALEWLECRREISGYQKKLPPRELTYPL